MITRRSALYGMAAIPFGVAAINVDALSESVDALINPKTEISYSQFLKDIKTGAIETVTIAGDILVAETENTSHQTYTKSLR